MPSKILGKSGDSLADAYDVAGSIAGVEELDSESVKVVHEMGHTIFSERLSGTIRRSATDAILQTVTWDNLLTDLPAGPFRIYGVTVMASNSARIAHCQVSVLDPIAGRELAIFVWDTADDVESVYRTSDDGAAVANQIMLRPTQNLPNLPQLLAGGGQPATVPAIAFRGLSATFGAGTVTAIMLLHIGFSQVGGLSSRGLPVPSW